MANVLQRCRFVAIAIACCQVVISYAFGIGSSVPQLARADVVRLTNPPPLGATTPSAPTEDNGTTGGAAADTLTTEELAERLRLVRASIRGEFHNATSPEAIAAQLELCDQIRSTRFRNLALSRSEARPSTVHGNGLFATRRIEADELITLYPGDALLAWGDEHGGRMGPRGCPLQAMYGPHVSEEERASPDFFLLRDDARDFEVACGRRRSIVGDPARGADPAYLGHLGNDAACLLPGGDVAAYEKISNAGANAAHLSLEGCHVVTVATRAIDVGEEILASYGEGYWRAKMGADNASLSSGVGKNANPSDPEKEKKKKKKKNERPPNRGFGKMLKE